MNNANKYSLQRADSLDDLATRICGFGYYANHNDDREHPVPKNAVKEYLEVGAAFQMKETEPKLQKLKKLKDMMKSMDAKAIADHKAVIDEFEYWRKLRGEIFVEMYRDHLAKNDSRKSEDDLLNKTKYLINQLWQQDQDFTFDKKVFHIPVK